MFSNVVDFIGNNVKKTDILNKSGLIIKAGFDPTGPDLHIGHLVLLKKLREMQDIGHNVVFIIGDFTAKIGDPTGKNKTRPELDDRDIKDNCDSFLKQVFLVLDENKTEIKFNSEWLDKFSAGDLIKLMSSITVSRMLDRRDFKDRFTSNAPISLHEFTYPLLQGFDSVAVKADIEIGGTDQLFNLNMGREIQELSGVKKQTIMTMPIINGLDGNNKMSKSLGNHIALFDDPRDMFGKVMSISDETMEDWILAFGMKELSNISHPMIKKKALAGRIIGLIRSRETAVKAQQNFEDKFSKNTLPEDIDQINLNGRDLINLCRDEIGKTGNELFRLINQGAIRINGIKVTERDPVIADGDIINIGKRIVFQIID